MKKLILFDIDDTLVHTQTLVHVVRGSETVAKLNSREFTHYTLQDGERFDFKEFSNARAFFENSKPIIPMMNQLKRDIAESNKVVMVTARADFDDRDLFLDTFRKCGIDIDKVHVYRAGNVDDGTSIEVKKKQIIRSLLVRDQYSKAIMYDDSIKNLVSFLELTYEFSATKFYAWAVEHCGTTYEYGRSN
jgi:FMN phosphatase YigB (HAD superfamily)